jgi:hypothetical protein
MLLLISVYFNESSNKIHCIMYTIRDFYKYSVFYQLIYYMQRKNLLLKILSLRYVYFHGFSYIVSLTSYNTFTQKQCILSEWIASRMRRPWRGACIVSYRNRIEIVPKVVSCTDHLVHVCFVCAS